MKTRSARIRLIAIVGVLTLVTAASASTIPSSVVNAVHGRVVGWSRSDRDWFVVYVDRAGRGWCGLEGASWRMALVASAPLPVHVVADRRIGGAMCGNELAWVRSGRFSDGRHREVAFMLWATPSLGASAFIYRIEGRRLVRLASFHGDHVSIGRGVVTVSFENRGRSVHGEIEDTYRFGQGRYYLVRRH